MYKLWVYITVKKHIEHETIKCSNYEKRKHSKPLESRRGFKKKKKGRENQQSQKPILLKINKIDKLLANWSRKKVRRQTTLGKEIDTYLAEV